LARIRQTSAAMALVANFRSRRLEPDSFPAPLSRFIPSEIALRRASRQPLLCLAPQTVSVAHAFSVPQRLSSRCPALHESIELMRVELAFGRQALPVDLPDGFKYRLLTCPQTAALADPTRAIESALARPTSGPSLTELARGKRSAAISVCDITRP